MKNFDYDYCTATALNNDEINVNVFTLLVFHFFISFEESCDEVISKMEYIDL